MNKKQNLITPPKVSISVSVRAIGNSRGVVIPKAILEQLGIEGQMDMSVEDAKIILSKPKNPVRKSWANDAKAIATAGENKLIAGYTPMQRYFLGYSLGWLGHTREEQEKNRLMTDVHSPAKYRVNGPFVDVDEFYTTFNIKPGSPMYRDDSLRVRIW